MASQRSPRRSSVPAASSRSPASSSRSPAPSSRSRATSFRRSNAPPGRGHAADAPREKQAQDQAENNVSHISRLPLDLLCKCFSKLECVYHIVFSALVCRAWRSALGTDTLWRDYYQKWHGPTQERPAATWHQAFVRDLNEGRRRLTRKAFYWAVEAGLLNYPAWPITDSQLAPGASLQMLAEHLGLTFLVRFNGGPQVRISAKWASFFPASVLLHYPFKAVKRNAKLVSLGTIEIVVLSERLSDKRIVVYSSGFIPWDAVTGLPTVSSSSPVRLLQRDLSPGVNLLAGTLFDGDRTAFDQEEVLFIKIGLHLHVVLKDLMKLDCRNIHDFSMAHVSVQLHTFEKLLWSQTFNQAIVANEDTLLQSPQILPGRPSLPWRSEAFSGELEQTVFATLTVCNPAAQVVGRCVKMFKLSSISEPCLEYSLSEGLRFSGVIGGVSIKPDRRQISAEFTCWIPFDEERENILLTGFRLFSL